MIKHDDLFNIADKIEEIHIYMRECINTLALIFDLMYEEGVANQSDGNALIAKVFVERLPIFLDVMSLAETRIEDLNEDLKKECDALYEMVKKL